MLVMSDEKLMWGLEAKAFSGPTINIVDDLKRTASNINQI